MGHVTSTQVIRRTNSLNIASIKPYISLERPMYLWSGCPQGMGCCGPPNKNNMNSSESNHPSKTKIIYASKWNKLEC